MWRLMMILIAILAGIWLGQKDKKMGSLDSVASFSLKEHKPFVIVLYAYNNGNWCEKSLRSIFEQDYNNYRVVMIDDGSIDQTEKVAKEFILKNNQDSKVLFIRNDQHLGVLSSLKRALHHCLDREVFLFFHAQDWFVSPNTLNRINLCYQNPDVWTVSTRSLEYPSYALKEEGIVSAYVNVLKEIRDEKIQEASFQNCSTCLNKALKRSCRKQIQDIQEPLQFINDASALY